MTIKQPSKTDTTKNNTKTLTVKMSIKGSKVAAASAATSNKINEEILVSYKAATQRSMTPTLLVDNFKNTFQMDG